MQKKKKGGGTIAKINNPKPMGFNKSSAKGKIHSNTGILQETGEK